MRIESKLCHISEIIAVVRVEGFINNKSIGSSHGEGRTVEIAEDKAIYRLTQRINNFESNQTEVSSKGNDYYKKLVELHNSSSKKPMTVEDIGGLECSKCHY